MQTVNRCGNVQSASVGYGSTAVDWGSFCGDLFREYCVGNIREKNLQGEVEVDESLWSPNKITPRRSQRNENMDCWFGGQEYKYVEIVSCDRRDTDTLLSLIESHAEKGSTVITGGWAAYSDLPAVGYTHYVTEHKKAFSWQCHDKNTGELKTIHTNEIEGACSTPRTTFKRLTQIEEFVAMVGQKTKVGG